MCIILVEFKIKKKCKQKKIEYFLYFYFHLNYHLITQLKRLKYN